MSVAGIAQQSNGILDISSQVTNREKITKLVLDKERAELRGVLCSLCVSADCERG